MIPYSGAIPAVSSTDCDVAHWQHDFEAGPVEVLLSLCVCVCVCRLPTRPSQESPTVSGTVLCTATVRESFATNGFLVLQITFRITMGVDRDSCDVEFRRDWVLHHGHRCDG